MPTGRLALIAMRNEIARELVQFELWAGDDDKCSNMDPHLIEDLMEKFVAWIDAHEELPKDLDRIVLVRYLKASDFDLEKAKSILYKSLKIRTANPHIFTNRDPLSPEIQDVIEIVWVLTLFVPNAECDATC